MKGEKGSITLVETTLLALIGVAFLVAFSMMLNTARSNSAAISNLQTIDATTLSAEPAAEPQGGNETP